MIKIRRKSSIAGIYQIKNIKNGKVYIGRSNSVTGRWYYHLFDLINNNHANKKLQADFNTYGLSSFNFNVLEIVKGRKNLIKKEKEYLDNIDFENNYNIKDVSLWHIINDPDINGFVNYINSKWLSPNNIGDKIKKYMIYKKKDKDEIINKILYYQLIDVPERDITFNRIIRFMKDTLGYEIESSRLRSKGKQYTYKLVIDFDEEYLKKKGITE